MGRVQLGWAGEERGHVGLTAKLAVFQNRHMPENQYLA